jgi:hypothetical protein
MADDSELAKSKFFRFTEDLGKWTKDGKTYWPTHISLRLTRQEAYELAERCLRAANRHDDGEWLIGIDLAGTLEDVTD